jgi:diguanylate cyclase (GGDEF)-like protein
MSDIPIDPIPASPLSGEQLAAAFIRAGVPLDTLQDTLSALANDDALTGLHNRRSFDHALVRECNRASRSQTRLALLMLDVDDFRALNNSRGHDYGDACLRLIAEIVGDEVSRSTDMTARIGDDAFAVLLPGASTEGASTLAERIRNAVRKRNLEHGGSYGCDYVTLSAGVASVVPRPNMDPRVLAHLADQALCGAKRLGRNQVGVAREADAAAQAHFEERLRDAQIQVGWDAGTKQSDVTASVR